MGLEKEILTIYSEANRPIGTENREDIIKKGLLVEGVQLWIINPDTNQVLMQKEASTQMEKSNKSDPLENASAYHLSVIALPTQMQYSRLPPQVLPQTPHPASIQFSLPSPASHLVCSSET